MIEDNFSNRSDDLLNLLEPDFKTISAFSYYNENINFIPEHLETLKVTIEKKEGKGGKKREKGERKRKEVGEREERGGRETLNYFCLGSGQFSVSCNRRSCNISICEVYRW